MRFLDVEVIHLSSDSKYFDRRFRLNLLHPKFWFSWLAIGLLLFFGLMPAAVRDPISRVLSKIVIKISKKPISVAKANLNACFPNKTENEINALIKFNIESFVLALLGQAELLVRSKKHIESRVNVNGLEHALVAKAQGKPVIFIMPHVWGIEYAGIRLHQELGNMVTMVKAHRNDLFNWFNNRMRSRNGGCVYMREAGIRTLLSELKRGNSFFYLPDEDLGPKKSVFAPFLGTVKATLPVVGRLAQAGNAVVLPIKIGYNSKHKQFDLTVLPPIEPELMQGKENEAAALNHAVEEVILAYPEQYMWFLKILKTRPEGEKSIYQ